MKEENNHKGAGLIPATNCLRYCESTECTRLYPLSLGYCSVKLGIDYLNNGGNRKQLLICL